MIYCFCLFFFNDTATTEIYTYRHTLSLHDALPILGAEVSTAIGRGNADLGQCHDFFLHAPGVNRGRRQAFLSTDLPGERSVARLEANPIRALRIKYLTPLLRRRHVKRQGVPPTAADPDLHGVGLREVDLASGEHRLKSQH